ncbi:hypothetical protein L2E82_12115 [Cichorium intybus]|uniref:Uncharacterized protein n=1 Tax=Cichorium intybus TaxID=13427 RepID=A0ACB9GFX3_CICIN|nr:hypothetical protein L2E82_12115 [Cichorium intybus]
MSEKSDGTPALSDVTQQPLCITYPAMINFELKSGLIHLLPTFRGVENEDPHKFLKEFHVVCTGMKPHDVTEDQIKLRAFPFAVQDSARDWLYYLPPGSVTTWNELAQRLLALSSRRGKHYIAIGNDSKGCALDAPSTVSPIINYFNIFEGLTAWDHRLLNASSGGSITDKTPTQIRELINTMAEDSKHTLQEDEWYPDPQRAVNEVNNPKLESQISELTKAVLMLTKEKATQPPVRPCGVCLQVGHPTDMCPLLQEETEEAKATGPFQRQYNQPRGNTGWNQGQSSNYQPRNHQQYQPRLPPQNQPYQTRPPPAAPQPSSSGTSLEDIVKSLATSTQTFQNETKASIKNLEQQMAQLASSVSKLEAQGKLPAQTETNPKHKAYAVTLRSGTQYEGPKAPIEEEELEVEKPPKKSEEPKSKDPEPVEAKIQSAPFPSRLRGDKREKGENEILEIFRKVEINIPLLEAIKQIPRYAKFLKELCTSKRKLKGYETVKIGENASAVLQRRIPKKCKDPGIFTVPCKLGNISIPRAMLDLGASINVLPYSVYKATGFGNLAKTGIIVQLADRSIVHPKGVLEDVLVQVNQLVFPADFYILDMGDDDNPNPNSILLGRPFLSTARTKIDVYAGTFSMEFDDEVINFNIYEAMKYPTDVHSLNFVDIIKPLAEELFELISSDPLSLVLNNDLDEEKIEELVEKFELNEDLKTMVKAVEERKDLKNKQVMMQLPNSTEKLLPSVVKGPKLELKTLPEHLKYVYLGNEETLPVIVSNKLTEKEEEELINLLKRYKKAIGWTIADIKGLSPSLCMHKILMEDDYKPSRQPQRRLNPPMMEVVKKEIMKLLNARMIYPISDSKWVSPVQVVPKKAGVTVVENEDGDLVPTRVQNGWRVCIDYRKLNAATRKDHFPLPFIDQMLERLAGKSH